MKVLLTGATGFLGSRILSLLIDSKVPHDVTILKRSFSNTKRIDAHLGEVKFFDIDRVNLDELFRESSYELIIHCATNFGRKTDSKSEILETNLLFPLRLLELGIQQKSLKIFINTDTLLSENVSDYSLSKKHFREWLTKFSDRVNVVNVFLGHFYGPNDDDTKFVNFIIRQLLSGASSIPLTLGNQRRDFIYIDDVLSAIQKIINEIHFDEVGCSEFHIGVGQDVSIKDLVFLAKELCDNRTTELKFGTLPYRQNELMAVNVDISKLMNLGWKPVWSLKDGLTRTIEYERANLT